MAIHYVTVASGTSDVAAVSGVWQLRLVGFSIGESGDPAATAEVKIYNGADANGDLIVGPINLAADGFGMFGPGKEGIPCPDGIFVERVSGTATITLYIDRV